MVGTTRSRRPSKKERLRTRGRRPKRAITSRGAPLSVRSRPSGRKQAHVSSPSIEPSIHNPFARPTVLIGREAEVATARAQLLRSDVRLLTFTGAPGIGKTRLALEVALEIVGEFPDGAFFVDLAPIAAPTLVVAAIARTLRVREAGNVPLLGLVKQAIGDRRLLLILDNFEQVMAAAPQVSDLLTACPRAKIIVTSRAALHLSWEHEFPVPPLRLPDLTHLPPADALSSYPAVALFLERAWAVVPEFTLTRENARSVAEICSRLDGLPLSINLAAARIKMLPPEAILERLQRRLDLLTGGGRDVPPRQQTLREAIDWSYELLDPREQQLFSRLSVFAGGCTLEAANAVCAPGGELQIDMLEGLGALVDKSLLQPVASGHSEPRYRILDTLREYGLERLATAGTIEQIQERHAAFFVALAERAEGGLATPEQAIWLERLERDHDNLRTVLSWAAERGDTERSLRLAAALTRFWLMRGYFREAREWLEAALSGDSAASGLARAKALRGAAHLLWFQGDYEGATAFADESLTLAKGSGDTYGVAFSLGTLGLLAYFRGDLERAVALLNEGLRLARDLSDTWLMALVLNNLARATIRQGQAEQAMVLLEESLHLAQGLGDGWLISLVRTSLGVTALQLGHGVQAAVHLKESLVMARHLRDQWGLAWNLEGLAAVAGATGHPERAARLLGAAEMLRSTMKTPLTPFEREDLQHTRDVVRTGLGEQPFEAAWTFGMAMAPEQAVEYALAVGASLLPTSEHTLDSSSVMTSVPLTHRQREVAALIAWGRTNREIATALVITERTAATHVQHILNKLGFSSRAQIAVWAVEHGLYGSPVAPE